MDEPRKQPIVLANRAIRLMVDHLVGEEYIVLPQDYMALRVTFRRNKGSWERVVKGDGQQIRFLADIVSAWGKMPGRITKTELG